MLHDGSSLRLEETEHVYFLVTFPSLCWSCSCYKNYISCAKMYCLQWLLPLLLIPKPANPFLLQNHSMFMTLYLASFFLERRPCTICTIVFVAAVTLMCYSGLGNCFFFAECNNAWWKSLPAARLLVTCCQAFYLFVFTSFREIWYDDATLKMGSLFCTTDHTMESFSSNRLNKSRISNIDKLQL